MRVAGAVSSAKSGAGIAFGVAWVLLGSWNLADGTGPVGPGIGMVALGVASAGWYGHRLLTSRTPDRSGAHVPPERSR